MGPATIFGPICVILWVLLGKNNYLTRPLVTRIVTYMDIRVMLPTMFKMCMNLRKTHEGVYEVDFMQISRCKKSCMN